MFCLQLKLIFFFYVDSELNILDHWQTRDAECHTKKQELDLVCDLCTCCLAKNVNVTSSFFLFFLCQDINQPQTFKLISDITRCINWHKLITFNFCRYEYHWADGTNIKKPIKCSAPKYIDYLMTWVQDQLDDETLFPSKIGEFKTVWKSY